jgi:hypothetical protein
MHVWARRHTWTRRHAGARRHVWWSGIHLEEVQGCIRMTVVVVLLILNTVEDTLAVLGVPETAAGEVRRRVRMLNNTTNNPSIFGKMKNLMR